jgi:N-ethylmaleimide reductase
MPDLFTPVRLGALAMSNRVVMAPLTRARAGTGDVPGPMNVDYYRQRASAGLVISEATHISPQGKGYAWTPGIYSAAQVAGWRLVTDAVHEAGGRMVMQLWHVGRVSHPDLQIGGVLPVAPSAVQPQGKAFTETGFKPIPTPRALELDEIPGIVADYAHAAENARADGFDGVEVHAANGYLIDQFLRDGTNKRTDRYGGSLENRTRFLVDVMDAVTGVLGADRVGIRLSPTSPANDAHDSDPRPIFTYAVEQLNRYGLAFIHVIEGATRTSRDGYGGFDAHELRDVFKGGYIGNNRYDLELAQARIASGEVDAVAFGRPFISNPDLVERLRRGLPLSEPDQATFYGGDAHGYVDYPSYGEQKAA